MIFRNWVLENFPFLEDDFDALTDYQLFCKMVEYMKNAVESVEGFQVELNAFNVKLNEFQHYFDNLDVDEEINHKLDEMAADGTLTNLIKNYVDPIYQSYENTINQQINNQNTNISNISTSLQQEINRQNGLLQVMDNKITSATSGAPIPVSSTSDMTDNTKIYVNTTNGNWYYYDGDSWEIGGTYQSTSIGLGEVDFPNLSNRLNTYIGSKTPTYSLSSGSYIDANLSIQEHASFSISTPIQLLKGETISFVGKGESTVVEMITICDSTGNNLQHGVASINSIAREYSLTAVKDIYVKLCSYTSDFGTPVIKDNRNEKLNYIDSIIISDSSTLLVDNEYVGVLDGIEAEYQGLKRSDYIPITPDTIIVRSSYKLIDAVDNLGLVFYDENKSYITGDYYGSGNSKSYNAPSNAHYIRYTVTQNMQQYGYEIIYTSLKNKLNDLTNKINGLAGLGYGANIFDSFLKFGVIGDSLASGESIANNGGTTHYVDNYELSWGGTIARKHNLEYVNMSAGGATTATWLISSWGLQRLLAEDNKCNSYIIGLGINDISLTILGSISDIHISDFMENANSFYGNYAKIIGYIKQVQPKAKIFCLTIPNGNVDYNNAIRDIVNLYSDDVYLIDLQNNYYNIFNSGFLYANKREAHWNAIGYNYIGNVLYEIINNYMLINYDKFEQIEFIGTDYSYTE